VNVEVPFANARVKEYVPGVKLDGGTPLGKSATI
jgi:hypothetical protein